jgi:hypothetical protein
MNIQRKIVNVSRQELQYVWRNIIRRSEAFFKAGEHLEAHL